MVPEILVAIPAGILLGVFTGMIPGIHINMVAAVILSVSPALLEYFPPLSLAVAIMAMSITHVFVDFVPSIFLGAPSDATALAVLPGHKMLLEGRGYEAVMLSAAGGLFSLLGIVLAVPALLVAVPAVFEFLRPHIGILLIGIAAYNVLREKGFEARFWTFAVFSLAGFLGIVTLGIPNLGQPLLPLLAGLFGTSTLMESMMRNPDVPPQRKEADGLSKTGMLSSSAAGAFSGGLMGILPALGPAQSAMLARNLIPNAGPKAYLSMLGAVSTASMLFGLVTLFAIDKARNGSIAIISEMLEVGPAEFAVLIFAAAVSAGLSVATVSGLAGFFAANIGRISYRKASAAVIGLILALTALLSGAVGIVVLGTGTAIGLIAISRDVPRHAMMGCLMVPVVLYYL